MGPRAGLDGRKMSSPPEFDPGPSSSQSVSIPTELPGPQVFVYNYLISPNSTDTFTLVKKIRKFFCNLRYNFLILRWDKGKRHQKQIPKYQLKFR